MTTENTANYWSTIGAYDDLGLIDESDKKGYKICPNCKQPKLSIASDKIKYTCYGCYDQKAIMRILEKKAYESGKKPSAKRSNSKTIDSLRIGKSFNMAVADNSSRIENPEKILNEENLITISHPKKILDFLTEIYKDRLAHNSRTNEIELDGIKLQLDTLKFLIADKHGVSIGKDSLIDAMVYLARKKPYDPCAKMLDRYFKQSDKLNLVEFCQRHFNPDKEIYIKYLIYWAVASVARVSQPGCKQDECLILQGPQGWGKSSFFKILGYPFYGDSLEKPLNSKDNLMKIRRNWIIDLGEFDSFSTKFHVGELKHFLQQEYAEYRAPYGKDIEVVPRASVFVATSNTTDFLNDPTGERRYWVIPVGDKRLDVDRLEKEVASFWAAAIDLYKCGHDWRLPPHLWQLQATENENYQQYDYWLEVCQDYLTKQAENGVFCTMKELFDLLEEKNVKLARGTQDTRKLSELLIRQGWQKKKQRIGDKTLNTWIKPS